MQVMPVLQSVVKYYYQAKLVQYYYGNISSYTALFLAI